jgi:Fe-S-cluster containining protein
MADDLPWYKDGLQFSCSQCGDCCSGAPGYVWVNNEEIAAMAALVGMTADAFEEQYVRQVGIRKSLKEFASGDCIFLDPVKRGCTIYDARPRQCRTWPFWDSNLKSPADWAHTCEVCPGSGKGKLYQLEQIEEQRKVMKV